MPSNYTAAKFGQRNMSKQEMLKNVLQTGYIVYKKLIVKYFVNLIVLGQEKKLMFECVKVKITFEPL